MTGFNLEYKAVCTTSAVDLRTQKSNSAVFGGNAKLEYDFTISNKRAVLGLSVSEPAVLTSNKLASAVVSAKIEPATVISSVTAKYFLDKKLLGGVVKLKSNKVFDRTLVSEATWLQGQPVQTETELLINSLTKFQVETRGVDLTSLKATRSIGKNQFKLKYLVDTKAPVLGLDIEQSPKWDLEYNIKTEKLDVKVKKLPLTLQASTTVGKSGFCKGGITYKLTGERTFAF